MDIRRIIRDSYLFEVKLKLLFSSLLGRRNGAFWAVLIQFVKDDDIGRVLVQNLSLQKSDIDIFISPSCVKFESKMIVQDMIQEE